MSGEEMNDVHAIKRDISRPAENRFEAHVSTHPWRSAITPGMPISEWRRRLDALEAEGAPNHATVQITPDGQHLYVEWSVPL